MILIFTVSYTHLDVYKRQVMPDPCQIIPIPSSMLNAESLSSASGSPIIGTITQGNTIISVSYTHLDVYKRQLIMSMLFGDLLQQFYLTFYQF